VLLVLVPCAALFCVSPSPLPSTAVLEASRDLVGIVGGVFVVGNSGFVQVIARDWQARGPFGDPSLVEHAARGAEYRSIPAGSLVANSSLKARWDGDGSRGGLCPTA
jgi:hypothetical protein